MDNKNWEVTTTRKCKCSFNLPEFHEGRDIPWNMYVDESDNKNSRYDMIIGRDLLEELGMNFLFSDALMTWDNASVPMRSPSWLDANRIDDFEEEIFSMHDPVTTEADRIQQILDAKYAPADLEKLAEESKHLTPEEQHMLLNLLNKYEHLFDGSLGKWDVGQVDLDLKEEDTKPYHAKPYPVPHSQEQKLREEVDRLVELKVLKKINRSEWAAPMFTVMKKDQTSGLLQTLGN